MLHLEMLKDLAQNHGAVRIEHYEDEPGRYAVAIRVNDGADPDDVGDDGFANIGVGLSMETAIEVAHGLQYRTTQRSSSPVGTDYVDPPYDPPNEAIIDR